MSDPAVIDPLRRALVVIRDGLIARLARKVDGDDIVLLGGVGAIAALDQAAAEAAPDQGEEGAG